MLQFISFERQKKKKNNEIRFVCDFIGSREFAIHDAKKRTTFPLFNQTDSYRNEDNRNVWNKYSNEFVAAMKSNVKFVESVRE